MKAFAIILSIVSLFFSACQNQNQEVFWVSGYQSECDMGAGKGNCLLISKAETLDSAEWELFYAPIENFAFEAGILKRIKVEKSEKENAPADASSYDYRMIAVIDSMDDPRVALNKGWTLAEINGGPFNRMMPIPNLQIDLSKKTISGTSGCNQYTGSIEYLGTSKVVFSPIVSSRRACIGKNIEAEYYAALDQIKSYEVDKELIFLDEEGKALLKYLPGIQQTKMRTAGSEQRLHDIWVLSRLNGNPVSRKEPLPRLEINLTKNMIMGDDGCNTYRGPISTVNDSALVFGVLAVTEKACMKQTIAQSYYEAMSEVSSYQFEERLLILVDEEGNEVLAFLKTD
ncbi:MAG: heat-shock protein HslJ [Flavobacteriales bacterium]|nr:heat-shock protein HslJ [Flavobacteriales bacterium]|tara:strand:+ start:429 stop:1457 length:1029 start_codon:yes stop_codon:yes gene_type:complete